MAAAQLVVDTDIVIDHLRRKTEVLNRLLARYTIAITAINLYELRSVPILSDRQRHALEEILQITDVISFDKDSAERAAEVWNLLQARGEQIGPQDTQIAGVCLANRLPLLTRNDNHFRRVPGLSILTGADISP